MKLTQKLRSNIQTLIDVLYRVQIASPNDRVIPEYRTIGRGEWKPLRVDAKLINLARYEYRLNTRNVWLSGRHIECSNGSILRSQAIRILEILKTRAFFIIGGYRVGRQSDGRITVGCSTFTKEDVAHAKQLLASK